MPKTRHAPPKAGAMIEALRGLGYSAATALADLIDNSISAGADQVDLTFFWSGADSSITVLDNGSGMDDQELDLAMRLGEKSPLDNRASRDLGRFGLGLKTASFSQCRRLTVASAKDTHLSCLYWDLDILAGSDDDGWHLGEGTAKGSEVLIEPLRSRTRGTLVVWEKLDRVVTPGSNEQDFLDLVDNVERHLAMVFHRYLYGVKPRLKLRINNRIVAPWDPFLTSHASTWTSPIERIQSDGGEIVIECHVLPHKDRLTAQEYEDGAGPDGWTAQQGFYVYRNERLLVAGRWLGLGRGRGWTKEEPFRLVRIRVDIPNTADVEWKIDIRKSMAKPPIQVRERLTRLAEDARERGRRVFARRGEPVRTGTTEPVAQAWRVERLSDGLKYRIDKTHPAVKAVLDEAGSLEAQVLAMLRIIEETIPVQRIWLDTAEARDVPRAGFSGEPPSEVVEILSVLYRNKVLKKGVDPIQARQQLLHTEPFNNYPELVAALPDFPSE